MSTPGQDFEAALDKWTGQVDDGMVQLARLSIQDIGLNVVLDTPVDTGFLRGGWQPVVGDALPDGSAKTSPDPSGAIASANITLTVANLEIGETYQQLNYVAYAKRLENGFVGEDSLGRHYNQPGRFFVRDNVARWPIVVAARAQQIWGKPA